MSDPTCPIALERGALAWRMAAPEGAAPVEWRIWDGLTDYETAVAAMEARADAIAAHVLGRLTEEPRVAGRFPNDALVPKTAGMPLDDGLATKAAFRGRPPDAIRVNRAEA